MNVNYIHLNLTQNCHSIKDCSRECQAADWKDHKEKCKIISSALGSKSEKFQAIAAKFTAEHKNSIYEAVAKCYDGNDLVLDLDFSNDSSPELPPAFRNPPEFEIFPANIFWNREKEKVSYIAIADLLYLKSYVREFLNFWNLIGT